MPDFKEVAIELRGITHSFESDFSVESLLKKRTPVARELKQPKINVNHLSHNNHANFNRELSNGAINGGLNHHSYANGSINGHLNGQLNNNNYTTTNLNYKNEDVQMIYLNQSRNFPSFYFRQNSDDDHQIIKQTRSASQDSVSKKIISESSYEKRNVLSNLNMTIPKGAIFGLLGPSGCGKTTLLKIITGVIKPDKGTVKVFNCNPLSGLGGIPGHNVGYMPQDYSLHDDLTVAEILSYFGKIARMDRELIKIKTKELVKLLDLPGADRVISTLSGGQKRRCSFCCAIIHMPKLLILDEPTVGCDPMLRERIWRLLSDFSTNNKMTVIITTHYIEEAKRSSLVGFMKKGCLMAENTPENLFRNYETNSLESIFYKLCITDKTKRRSSEIASSNLMNKPGPLTNRMLPDQSHEEREKAKNFYFYDKELPPSSFVPTKRTRSEEIKIFFTHLKALSIKQMIYSVRKPETTVAQFIVPLIVVMFFCVCVGSLPKEIPIGIFNEENCTTNDICLSEDLITYLNSYALKKINYNNFTEAMIDAKKKRIFGILSFGPNFTDAFQDKLHFDSTSKIIDQSVITFNGDHTNSVLLAIFTNIFYSDYFDFIKYALNKLDLKPSYGNLPVTIGQEVFGKYVKKDYSAINAYAAPGLLIIIVYSVSFALTGLALLLEKTNGVFERNQVSGVTTNCMLISHLVINMSVFAVGLFFLLQMTTRLYDIPVRGSFIAGYCVLLLQCLTGLANGLLLSSIMDELWAYAIVGNGILLFIFITSGALWPLEAQPFYINWIANFLPSTLAIESLRSILVRGISITMPIVYNGFLISIAWSVVMIVTAGAIFKFRQGLKL